jgi:hypothetical protein
MFVPLFVLHLFLIHSVKDGSFVKVLTKAAGIYVEPSMNKVGVDLSKTVLIVGVNFGYLKFLHNFKCYLDQLSLKAIVLSIDQRAHDYVVANMGPNLHSYLATGQDEVKEEPTNFNSQQFHVITNRKKEGVLLALRPALRRAARTNLGHGSPQQASHLGHAGQEEGWQGHGSDHSLHG